MSNNWNKSWFIENIVIEIVFFIILGAIAVRWGSNYVILGITICTLCLSIILAIIVHFNGKKDKN